MTILVVGATGKTGRPLVEQLLANNHKVRVIVRSFFRLPAKVLENPNLKVVEASLLDLTDEELMGHVKGCDAVVSCLGHVINFKGVFGEPRRLCTEATRRLCVAMEKNRPAVPAKFILMNTVAVTNPDLQEQRRWFEQGVLTLLHYTLPPHRDNETAAEYLHDTLGTNNKCIEWCSVRPDSLIDAEVSAYDVNESISTGIFSGQPTARSNVAHFMVALMEDADLWSTWKFRMPVIMNASQDASS